VRFRLFDIPVEIVARTAAIAAQVEALFDVFQDDSGCDPRFSYEIVGEYEGFELLRDGIRLESLPRVSDPMLAMEEYVMRDVIAERPGITFIHAAVLAKDDMALLLPGRSGAGKSTLAFALAIRGWTYYSDELAPIDSRTMEVLPFPRGIKLRPGAAAIFPHLATHFSAQDGQRHYCRVRELGLTLGQLPVPVRLLVFPQYSGAIAPALLPLPRPAAVTTLAKCCLSFSRDQGKALQQIAIMVGKAHCFELQTGELGESCAVLERMAQQLNQTEPQTVRG
jgi:hypothetical protein